MNQPTIMPNGKLLVKADSLTCAAFSLKLLNNLLAGSQVYKWVPANLMLQGNPVMDWHPIQGGVEILLVISSYRNRDKLQPDGPQLACMQTSPTLVLSSPGYLQYEIIAPCNTHHLLCQAPYPPMSSRIV